MTTRGAKPMEQKGPSARIRKCLC